MGGGGAEQIHDSRNRPNPWRNASFHSTPAQLTIPPMRGKLIAFGIFGLVINAFLYFRGGWMPTLLIAALACLVVAIFLPSDNSSSF